MLRPDTALRRAPVLLLALLVLTGRPEGVAAQTGGEDDTRAALLALPEDSLETLQEKHDLLHDPLAHVKAFASDGWAVVAAPTRLRGRDAWTFAGVVGVGALLFAVDEPLTEELMQNSEAGLWEATEEVGEFFDPVALMSNTNAYWFGGMVLSDLAGQERFEVIFKELLWSHWLAGLTRKSVGKVVGRTRPEDGFGAYEFGRSIGTSFPSGHASTITQVAAVLSHHIDRWPATVLLYGMAASVVYQRVSSGKHWASDSWLGAAWGWGVSQVVIHRRETFRDDFVPFFDPATGGLGVRVPVTLF